jgi:hypothetical protein
LDEGGFFKRKTDDVQCYMGYSYHSTLGWQTNDDVLHVTLLTKMKGEQVSKLLAACSNRRTK